MLSINGKSGRGALNKQAIRLLVVLAAFALSACATSSNYSTVNTDVLEDIQQVFEETRANSGTVPDSSGLPPENILQALVPGLTLNSDVLQPIEQRFDFAVVDPMSAREFFSLLTVGTDYSIAVHPSVSGSISALDLKNVTISEALDQVSALYGFVINRSGNVYQILPGGLQTKIFKVDYLNVTRNGSSNMQIVANGLVDGAGNSNNGNNSGFGNNNGNNNGGGFSNNNGGFGGQNGQNGQNGFGGGGSNSGGASINTTTEADYWEGLEEILSSIINTGQSSNTGGGGLLASLSLNSATERSVVISPQTGMIVVRAYPDELDLVETFLASSQSSLQRQVVLEAKILEVELKEGFQAGIDLNALGKVNTDNSVSAEFSFLGDQLGGIGSPLSLSYDSTDFSGVIRLLETQGNVQVISSPRISTLNNQKAVFKVGTEQYFLTQANSTSFGSGDEATTNQNTNLQPFFSGIALDVTPQISDEGDIILHIHPILSQVQEDIRVISGEEFPLANSTTRESDSIARAKNGEVIIISGLMQTRSRGAQAGIPGVSNIPLVGTALSQRQSETVKTELVILLRAIVDEDDLMQEMIQESNDGFEALRREIDPYYR